MGKPVKENSTEKLLDVIRGVSHKTPPINISTTPREIKSDPIKPGNLKKINKKTLNLGVLLTQEDVTFVLSSNKKKALIKWINIKLPDNLAGIEDKKYALFLQSRLENFTEGIKGIPAWCVIDSAKLKLRNITIPDIAPAKISNAAFWGLKKELDFDANQEIFNLEIIGDIIVHGIKKKNLLAFTAEKNQVNKLKILFSKSGFNLKGITTIPFAIQNFIHSQHLQTQDSPFSIVNISRKNSEIVCFSDTGILLARNIRMGSYNLVENFIKSPDKNVIKYLSSLKGIQSDGFLKIKQPCERLIEKIVRTSEYCSQNFADNIPIKNFFFYGEASDCDPFMEFAANTTLTDVKKFDPVVDLMSVSTDGQFPENIYIKGQVITAFGISLSSNDHTPNFLHTFNDKLKINKQRKINIAASIIFVLISLFCTSFTSWQGHIENQEIQKLDEAIQLKNKLNPNINQDSMFKMISKAEKKIKLRNQYISDYFPLAVINEICSTTPGNISVSSLEVDLTDQKTKKKDRKQKSKGVQRNVIIDGSIKNNFDSDFTEYILHLGNSKILGDIEVLEKNINDMDAGKILNFKLRVEII